MHYELWIKKILSDAFIEKDVSKKTTQYADKTSIEITIATTNNAEMVVNEDCYADKHKHKSKIIDKFFHIFRYLVASSE